MNSKNIMKDWSSRINVTDYGGRLLTFNLSKNGLFVGGRVQHDIEWKFFASAEYDEDNNEIMYQSSFADTYLKPFIELQKVDLISIAFGNNFPLIIHCLGDSLNLIGYVAPRIEDL